MKLTVLDIKEESAATCFLCKVELVDYIKSIPETYRDFDVQRGIVTNRYLDHLADTIYKKKHIPPIVLIADKVKRNNALSELHIGSYHILDGLQRTHRLKVIWDVLDFLLSSEDRNNIGSNPGQFIRRNASLLRQLGGDVKLTKSLVDYGLLDLNSADEFFAGNSLWLEVWTGLSEYEQVEKMLLLNAGHKSVNIKHQLELLFLSTLFNLEKISPAGVKFIREKDQSAIQYSKTRQTGEYHFSHIISSLIALSAGKIINTNSDYISGLQANQDDFVELVEGFNLEFVRKFIDFLYALDREVVKEFKEVGTKWLGREVVLIGLFAAIGEFTEEQATTVDSMLANIKEQLPRIVKSLKLKDFEAERNNVELNKVNVGNVNKKAVYRAMSDLLRNKKFGGWQNYFRSAS